MTHLRTQDVLIEVALSIGRWLFVLAICAVLVVACVTAFQVSGFHLGTAAMLLGSLWGIGTALQISVEEDSDTGTWGNLIEWAKEKRHD